MRLTVPFSVIFLMLQTPLAQVIRVPSQVEVSADNLVLADIAEIHPFSSELAAVGIG